MVWYGKNKEEKKDSSDRFKKKKDKEVSLTARYCNSDDDGITVHDNYEDDDISLTTMRGRDD